MQNIKRTRFTVNVYFIVFTSKIIAVKARSFELQWRPVVLNCSEGP